MAVQFELYKTPMPKEKKNKTRYHARPVSFETVNTENNWLIASMIAPH